MLLTLFFACQPVKVASPDTGAIPTETDDSASDSVEVEDTAPPALTVSISGPGVIDPLLAEPDPFVLGGDAGALIAATVLDSSGALVATLADGTATTGLLRWDGHADDGSLAAVGDYTLAVTSSRAGYTSASATFVFSLVRLGVSDGTLGGEDRLDLIWHRNGGSGRYYVAEADAPTFLLSALLAEDGTAAAVPAVWEDLEAVPESLVDQNMPAAYPYDALPTLSLTFAGEVGTAVLSAEIEGWTLVSGSVATGTALVFQRDSALAAGPKVVEETLTLSYTANGEPVASQDIPLRIYATFGPPTFDSDRSPNLPWVAVIDPALRTLDGIEPDETAILSALVEYIFNDFDISYDTTYGASAYMSYPGGWDSGQFDMSAFLERSHGEIVNCSDCSGILTVYANMLGVYLGQTIISPSFNLNYIEAIGYDEFTSCPFGPYSCGFSYHAVTSPDDGETIYDATLALDGDDDPGSTPNEVLLVQEITGDEYLDRLVRSGSPYYSPYGTGKVQ